MPTSSNYIKNNSDKMLFSEQDLDYVIWRLLLDIKANETDPLLTTAKVDYHKISKLSDLTNVNLLLTFDFDGTNPQNYFPSFFSSSDDRIFRACYRFYLTVNEGLENKKLLQNATNSLWKDLVDNFQNSLIIKLENGNEYSVNLKQTETLELPTTIPEFEDSGKVNYTTSTFLLKFKFKRIN